LEQQESKMESVVTSIREVNKVVQAHHQREGAGFVVRRL